MDVLNLHESSRMYTKIRNVFVNEVPENPHHCKVYPLCVKLRRSGVGNGI